MNGDGAMNARQSKVRLGEVLFEFIRVGRYVKVSAMDPITLTEISIVGDPNAGTRALKEVAKRKLEYVIAKKLGFESEAANKKEDDDLY